jgi:hypothetical protein
MTKGYYKLKKSSCFWDRTQPKGTPNKIVADFIVELEETPKVLKARGQEAIVLVEKSEYDKWKNGPVKEVVKATQPKAKVKGVTTINTNK